MTPLTEAKGCQPGPSDLGGFVLVDPLWARLPRLPLASLIDAGWRFRPRTASLPSSSFPGNRRRPTRPGCRSNPTKKRFGKTEREKEKRNPRSPVVREKDSRGPTPTDRLRWRSCGYLIARQVHGHPLSRRAVGTAERAGGDHLHVGHHLLNASSISRRSPVYEPPGFSGFSSIAFRQYTGRSSGGRAAAAS